VFGCRQLTLLSSTFGVVTQFLTVDVQRSLTQKSRTTCQPDRQASVTVTGMHRTMRSVRMYACVALILCLGKLFLGRRDQTIDLACILVRQLLCLLIAHGNPSAHPSTAREHIHRLHTSFPLGLFFPFLCLIPFKASVRAILTCCFACSAVSLMCLMIAVRVSAVGLSVERSFVSGARQRQQERWPAGS
jgi:hypothetical protein